MPDDKRPEWLAEETSKEEWLATRRNMRAVTVRDIKVDEAPSWLAAVQPTKKEWSPVQDRMHASLRELAERRRRRREAIFKPFRRWIDFTAALVEARAELKAQAEAEAAEERAIEAAASTAAPPRPAPTAPPATAPPAWAEPAHRSAPPSWAEPHRPSGPPPSTAPPQVIRPVVPTPHVPTPKVVRHVPPQPQAPPPPPPPAPRPVVVPPPQPGPPPAPPPLPAAPPPAPAAAPPPMPVAPPRPAAPPPMPASLPGVPAAPAAPPEPEVEVVEPAAEAEPEPEPEAAEQPPRQAKPKKERKPRTNPLVAVVTQAKVIQDRREQQRQAERAQIMGAIRRMDDEAYETMLLDFFRRDGYVVYRVDDPGSSAADLEIHRANERQLVSIRHRGHVVGQDAVRELDKEVASSSTSGAFLFTDSHFSEAAIRVANNSHVTLVDGTMLAELIEELTMSELRERRASARLAKAIGWGRKAS